MATVDDVGIVVIGRNEGARLECCLSAIPRGMPLVYVDSGSSDGSQDFAARSGAIVVDLDVGKPFTAARARNAGFRALIEHWPSLSFVHFLDGDCELRAAWLEKAKSWLLSESEFAVVCGRRRERYAEASVWNRLCDIEWDTPVGEALACGGDAMMRVEAFQHVGGFNENLIAGEEPELCVRLRQAGWRIFRLDYEMCWHDAAMTEWRQWWRRSVRAGHAFAEGAALHGAQPERHWVRETLSILVWGGILPALILLATVALSSWYLLAFIMYPLQVLRIARSRDVTYSVFLVAGKFPQFLGAMRFYLNSKRNKRPCLIEYK